MNTFNVSRRSFLKRCSVAAAATSLPLWYLEGDLNAAPDSPKSPSPNDRPGIALVGCGSRGRGDAGDASRFGEIVAVCDVDENHASEAAKQFTKGGKTPFKCSDFRKIMERDDVHVIVNGTPDHWHTLVNLAAVKAHKDVYAEKPLTLTIDEGKHLIKAVRDNKAILQTGTQQRSDGRFRMACELIRNGRLGKLKGATVWLPAGPHGGPFKSSPVPKELDWNLWQGQAPAVDYVKERCHSSFRYWYEYSGGTLTDWGAHHNDIAYWAIGLLAPEEIEAKTLVQPIAGGYTATSEYQIKCTYANGVVLDIRTTKDDSLSGGVVNAKGQRHGIRFEGTDGWIWVTRGAIDASDSALLQTPLPSTAERLYRSNNHMGNFFDCVRSRKLPICDVEIGHRSATICHLGATALRTGLKLKWDSAAEKFVGENAAAANAYVTREMRKPYDYSFVA